MQPIDTATITPLTSGLQTVRMLGLVLLMVTVPLMLGGHSWSRMGVVLIFGCITAFAHRRLRRLGPALQVTPEGLRYGQTLIARSNIRALHLGADQQGGYLSWSDGITWRRLQAPCLASDLESALRALQSLGVPFTQDPGLRLGRAGPLGVMWGLPLRSDRSHLGV